MEFPDADNRPYPRKETCKVCNERECEVISPADWSVCDLCHLALMDEVSDPYLGTLHGVPHGLDIARDMLNEPPDW